MSVATPAFQIPRVSVAGEENEWVKMFDPRPVGASPILNEPLRPTNPVPEVMAASGVSKVSRPRTLKLNLLNGITINSFDGAKQLRFFTFAHDDLNSPFNGGQYPAPTIRVPRGVVFHGQTNGKGPPPHTIHWHGIEPTPMNDGVGHCSMEIGGYTYQWQPNFIGSYFYHCHRNTMQHFEFGLFGDLFILPPDAYFASVVGSDFANQTLPATIQLNNIPIGACSDGKFRTAANVSNFSNLFPSPQFVSGDPTFGVAGAGDIGVGDPHAFTVAYDVEAIWVLDDRDSTWSDLANNAFNTFPQFGSIPGVNDQFNLRPGSQGFFAFNDFRPDYFFVTGVPFLGNVGNNAAPLDNTVTHFGTADGTIPAALNSGVVGSQVAIKAQVGQTILIRCLDAAYAKANVTFPVDVIIIAWDGRALGVPPFGLYNHSFLVPAGTPIKISTARRFDALIKAAAPTPPNTFVNVEFQNTRGDDRLLIGQIPFTITA